jgi:hypothetical protein
MPENNVNALEGAWVTVRRVSGSISYWRHRSTLLGRSSRPLRRTPVCEPREHINIYYMIRLTKLCLYLILGMFQIQLRCLFRLASVISFFYAFSCFFFFFLHRSRFFHILRLAVAFTSSFQTVILLTRYIVFLAWD